MDAHILLSPVGQKTETRFNCFLTENRKSTEMVVEARCYQNDSWSARRVIGATAKPLYPIDGKAEGLDRRSQRPPSREVFGVENRRFESYRRARDTRPYNVAENCNCEMCLQRWVASLQRSDVFATVGCTADPRRGAPVYPRCYNNPSSGRAKGDRGDRKAPICNRRKGRRP